MSSFLSNDFGSPPSASSPLTAMPKVPTIQDMLNNIGASTVNLMQPNPYLVQNQIPLPVPNLTFNPFLHLNPAISQEIIQQFIAMSFNTPTVLANMANMGEDEGPCKPKMRRGDLLKSVSLDSTEDLPSSITLDSNGDMIVPNNDKEGWCRNKKYIESTENGYMCTICRKVYGRYNSVSYHVTIYHRNPPIKCNMPNCQFTTREARYIHFHKLYRHGIALPQSIDQGSRKCPHCRHVSKSPAMLEKHIRRHQLKDDLSGGSIDLSDAMRERTSTICDEPMEVESSETEVVLETKLRSCTL